MIARKIRHLIFNSFTAASLLLFCVSFGLCAASYLAPNDARWNAGGQAYQLVNSHGLLQFNGQAANVDPPQGLTIPATWPSVADPSISLATQYLHPVMGFAYQRFEMINPVDSLLMPYWIFLVGFGLLPLAWAIGALGLRTPRGYCPNCGTIFPAKHNRCPNCGTVWM